MSENIRLFTAISLPERVRDAVRNGVSDRMAALPFKRRTHPDDWHITLHFIGDCAPADVPRLEAAIRESAAASAPFTLSLSGIGTFGNAAAPAVLWLGVGGEQMRLERLHRALGEQLERTGLFRPDSRPYRPHLTLARKYAGTGPLAADDAVWPEPSDAGALSWEVRDIVLYRSHLGRSPMYEPLAVAPLGGVRP